MSSGQKADLLGCVKSLLELKNGRLYWLVDHRRVKRGAEAGWRSNNRGYRRVTINGTRVPAHVIVWALVHGEWPVGDVDHINGVTDDNRPENLRVVTHQQNCRNSRKRTNNTSGFKGVSAHKASGKWEATIQTDHGPKYLGLFSAPELAADAYARASQLHHGKFGRAA